VLNIQRKGYDEARVLMASGGSQLPHFYSVSFATKTSLFRKKQPKQAVVT